MFIKITITIRNYLFSIQPLLLMQVTRPHAASSDVSRRTTSRQSQELQQLREVISGGDASKQLQDELHCLSSEERKQLLRDSGFRLDVSAEQGLAMKADLAIPWNQLRTIRRYRTTQKSY